MTVTDRHTYFQYSLGAAWLYLHTEGITEVAGKLLLEFKIYRGKSPTHLFQGQRNTPMYEVCCCEVHIPILYIHVVQANPDLDPPV